ncbi:lantibiotic dehydratase C-terminal domain-containing protein [Streptomyces boncukensis]|uniref:Bacteriocin biosynthesis protein n=1 Tax=Streptomyces boncukensis TaxID=2711219 RepID=A0A6G4X014_9ACTN|nr:lantibiotic dehydratase C-terminal domain-containing protein [Streptomyces boncukensis]NGO70094.1 bacteriocin biosynthesis protein [Streptomyces boncukensis]
MTHWGNALLKAGELRTFLAAGTAAGIAAVRGGTAPASRWVQFNLAPRPGAREDFYRELAVTVRELLADGRAVNFSYLHREPGIRVRFEAPDADSAVTLSLCLRARFARSALLREAPVRVVYEPEHYLFGGPASMPYVHRLFTADSLGWLDHHLKAPGRQGELTAWRHSLLTLREVFAGLGIVGWEHRGVWAALREKTGRGARRAPGGAAAAHGEAVSGRVAEGIAAFWRQPREQSLTAFPAACRATLARHADTTRARAAKWRMGYFEAGEATVGPCAAAAYYTVFHWNRGLLSPARQHTLTDVLAAEPTGEGDRDVALA